MRGNFATSHWYRRTVTTVVAFAALIVSVLPQGVHADTTHSSLVVHATIGSFSINPNLALTFAVDKSTAIPGDTLTYSGTVTHTGITACLPGTFSAQNIGGATATIADFFDEIDTWDPNQLKWVPLVGVAYTQTAYVPVATPLISTGITLTATSVPATGVTYPSSGNPIIGTQIAPNATAVWNGSACITLTAAQLQTLANASSVREQSHFEDTPGDINEAWTDNEQCPSPFNLGFLAAKNVVVTVTPPSGSAVQITSSQVPAFSSLAVGASANYSTTYKVPVPAARGSTETEASYLQRLTSLQGLALVANASVQATGPTGPVSATAPPVTTTEQVPIVTITKSGPTTVPAGKAELNPLALQNSGGATASGIAITDSVPSSTAGTVTGIPSSLVGGASSSGVQASFPVPVTQSTGPLTDTAVVTWQDANGNSYGSLSSTFTTQVLAAYKLKLTGSAGPNPIGAIEALTVTVVDYNGQPVPNVNVFLNVAGANAQQSTVLSDAAGVATFSYAGSNAGTDVLQASTSTGAQSNTLIVTWFKPIQKVTTTAVQGNFYAELSNPQSFVVTPQSVPDFGQTFPTIDFNPPPGTIPHSPPGAPTDVTRPFTDVTTDVNGNYNGTIIAQGNSLQAGQGNLANFDAVFTANFIVAQAGDVTFNFNVDDGFLFGVSNGATRVSGAYENAPASNASAIQAYPLMGAFNLPGSGTRSVTVHFPAAGTYPYELDYFEANTGGLSLTMSVATFNPQTNPLSIYVGYADGLRAAGSIFPFPWLGSAGVNFIGCCPAFDAGAVRFDNSSNSPIVLDSVTVDVGGAHFDLWGRSLTVPANQILILSQTGQFNFDTSDFSSAGCGGNNGVIPTVNVTIGGVTTVFKDTNQILNTFGFDLACRGNESQSWQRIGGGGSTINVPLPPATALALTPATVSGDTVGQTQTFTVAAMDATGNVVPNLPVTLTIAGANGGPVNTSTQINATTDSGGLARFSYVGLNAGTDAVQVNAFVMGLRSVSNTVSVPWALSSTPTGGTAPAPAITSPAPPDGSVVTKPIPISASFSPPSGQTITAWNAGYQGLAPGSASVTLASGTGAPPSTLATFDPTLLANGTYAITISATASGGGVQTLTTSVIVSGNLKLGRYVTTYRDLNTPVTGIQMALQRTYDSLDKRSGDFGIGWHLDLVNVQVTTNRPLGLGGWTQYDSQCGIGLCLTAFKTSAPHFVIVRYPDGRTESFDFSPTGGTNVFGGGGAAFTARPGTTSTLQADGDTSLSYRYDGNLYGGNGLPYDPQRFKLTTRDGIVLLIDRTTGLVSETDRNGNSVTVDAAGVHSFIGPAPGTPGPSIAFTRDTSNRISAVTGPSNQKLAYSYSSAGDLVGYTDANGNLTTFTYDASHNLLNTSGAGKPLSTLGYDASGRLTSITDGAGNTTQISNNVTGQSIAVTDALGKVTTVASSDDIGDIVHLDRVSGGLTQTTTFMYDSLGHPLSSVDPLGHSQSVTYDAQGDPTSYTDPNGNVTQLAYNTSGQPTSITGPDGVVAVAYTYDSQGNLTSLKGADGSVIGYTYDSAGRVTAVSDALNRRYFVSYDANGHPSSISDPSGQSTVLSEDASGRLTSTTDPLGGKTTLTYDGIGNLTQVTDAVGHVRTFTYDAQSRVTSNTDVLGAKTTYQYDAVGRVNQMLDRAGQTTTYSYDADSHLQQVTYPGTDTLNLTYDGFGRSTGISNATSSITSTFDASSRLTSQTTSGLAPLGGVTLNYSYDAAGNRVSLSGPDGTTSYTYDSNNRLTSITDPSGGHFGFSYDVASRLASMTRPNGISDAFAFNAAGQMTSQTSTLGATTIAQVSRGYDTAARLASATDANGTTSYAHDANGQVTSVTRPAQPSSNYTYDAVGNRTSEPGSGAGTLSYDGNNRLLGDATYTYAYNAEGDRTSRTNRTTGAITTYDYNSRHQLLAVHNPDGTTTSYRYDPLGRRVQVTSGTQTTSYIYDGANAHLEYSGSALAATYTDSLGIDQPLEMLRGGTPSYYLRDGVGNVNRLTDSTGATQATFSYDAFGIPGSSTGTVQNPYTFQAREYDGGSGLYYYRARYYDPRTGTFLSEDPLQAVNAYSFLRNNPLDLVDPTGTQAQAEYSSLLTRVSTAALNILKSKRSLACGWGIVGAAIESVVGGSLNGKLDVKSLAYNSVVGCMIGYAFPGADANGPLGTILKSLFVGGQFLPFITAFLGDIGMQVYCHHGFNNINYGHALLMGLIAAMIGRASAMAGLGSQAFGATTQKVVPIVATIGGGVFAGFADHLPGGADC